MCDRQRPGESHVVLRTGNLHRGQNEHLPRHRGHESVGNGADDHAIRPQRQVLAMLLQDQNGPTINLVEANHRKAQFLAEASRITGARAIIHRRRIESIHDLKVDVVTARACASLKQLFEYAHPVLVSRGTCLFLKGQNFQEELTESEKTWRMKVTMTKSLTNDSGVILTVRNLFRRL